MDTVVQELQQELLQKECDIIQILRKCRLYAANNSNLKDFDTWVYYELNGYTGHEELIPSYRKVTGKAKARNIIGQWVPVVRNNGTSDEKLSTCLLHHDLPALVELYEKSGKNEVFISLPAEKIKSTINKSIMGYPSDMALFIQGAQIRSIIEAVKSTLLDWLIKADTSESCSTKEEKLRLLDLIDSIPDIRKSFSKSGSGPFGQIENIYSKPKFIAWSEEIKAELRKLNRDELIAEIFDLISRFNGFNDKRLFESLEKKLMLIKNSYEDYSMKKETDATPVAKSAPNVTNIYFQGNMQGSNIATGNNVQQKQKAPGNEKKTFFEKYWFPLLLTLIGVAGTIIAACIQVGVK